VTVSQSVSLGIESHLGLMSRYFLLFDIYGLVFVGRLLWREVESVFCICCWSLPAQSFSGPSPLGLATIFYSLRFETSVFVASYDSQSHGGGIRHGFDVILAKGYCSIDSARTTYQTPLILIAYCFTRYPATTCLPRNLFVELLPSKGNPCSNILNLSIPSSQQRHNP
jgi:hypothetical protein